MAGELLRALIEAMLAGSAACALVLLLRRPWRHLLGAISLPWLWALVPAAMLGVLLPAWSGTHDGAHLPGVVAASADLLALARPAAEAAVSGGLLSDVLLALWLGGSLLSAGALVAAQRRFLRRLGPLRSAGGPMLRAASREAGPAVIGLLRPRIVLPADFEARFDATQRRLILAHELSHLRRGDVPANALAAALRALYWFNPLFHLAAERLRHDQELAADAAVLARYPHARRRYADTLLASQLAVPGLPVGCLWQSSQSLKERILMMKRDSHALPRQRLGQALAALVLGAGAVVAWAAQPQSTAAVAGSSDPGSEVSLIEAPPPRYPAEAVEARQQGKVVLRVLVDTSGKAKQVEVESSTAPGIFEPAAIAAAKGWRFNPAQREGGAVESWVLVPVCFALDEQVGCEAIETDPTHLPGKGKPAV